MANWGKLSSNCHHFSVTAFGLFWYFLSSVFSSFTGFSHFLRKTFLSSTKWEKSTKEKFHKTLKHSDTFRHSCTYPNIVTICFCHRNMCPNDADGMANSAEPYQTAPLILVYTVCSGLSVQKFRTITVGDSIQHPLLHNCFIFIQKFWGKIELLYDIS